MTQMTPKKPNEPQTDEMGFPRLSILDSVIYALTGTPDSMLTPEQLRDRNRKRNDAYGMAKSAQQSPGAEFMGPPDLQAGGKGLIKTLIGLFGG